MTVQAKEPLVSQARPGKGANAAKAVLAAGGLLAAFGVASCCALPIALSLLGIGAASLVGIGFLAAQYQQELFYAAVACLGAAAFLTVRPFFTVRQRTAGACTPGAAPASSVLDWGSKLAIVLALGLLALTFWIEPPL
jgi:mercuric ion transport protein